MAAALAIGDAFKAVETGDYEAAKQICAGILEQDAENAEALHLLGVLAYQVGLQAAGSLEPDRPRHRRRSEQAPFLQHPRRALLRARHECRGGDRVPPRDRDQPQGRHRLEQSRQRAAPPRPGAARPGLLSRGAQPGARSHQRHQQSRHRLEARGRARQGAGLLPPGGLAPAGLSRRALQSRRRLSSARRPAGGGAAFPPRDRDRRQLRPGPLRPRAILVRAEPQRGIARRPEGRDRAPARGRGRAVRAPARHVGHDSRLAHSDDQRRRAQCRLRAGAQPRGHAGFDRVRDRHRLGPGRDDGGAGRRQARRHLRGRADPGRARPGDHRPQRLFRPDHGLEQEDRPR